MFSPACPTRTPGDQCFVPGTFFQGYVSGEEKMKRIEARLASERAFDKDPSLSSFHSWRAGQSLVTYCAFPHATR
jgi:hypothetical protein